MKFSKIKTDNMRLGDDAKVSSTVIRQATSDEFSSGVLTNSTRTWAEIMYEQEERDTQNAINTLKRIAEKTSTKIKDVVLNINQPFNKTDLYHILKTQHNIDNPVLTNEVLDSLCDNGLLRYTEIENNVWAFMKVSA